MVLAATTYENIRSVMFEPVFLFLFQSSLVSRQQIPADFQKLLGLIEQDLLCVTYFLFLCGIV